jgi:ribonuclease P protein component
VQNNKIQSIKSKKTINALFNSSNFLYSKLFKITYIKNNENTLNFLIAVSKKKFNTSPLRNKAKRWVRSILNECTLKGYDVCIFANNLILKTEFQNIKSDLSSLLNKIDNNI